MKESIIQFYNRVFIAETQLLIICIKLNFRFYFLWFMKRIYYYLISLYAFIMLFKVVSQIFKCHENN